VTAHSLAVFEEIDQVLSLIRVDVVALAESGNLSIA